MSAKYSTEYIYEQCKLDEGFKENIELLDQYDFSQMITEGRSLWNLRDTLEDLYDDEFFKQYKMYMFDYLSGEDLCHYLASRYNVWFQEYTDWVVRHDHGTHEKTRRRT